MSLSGDLGYEYPPHGPVRSAVARLAATKPAAHVLVHIMHHLDRASLKINGRSTVTSALTGLPVLWVTTTGARSGTKRTVPLLGIPHGEGLALMGTHFGTRSTPGWVHNLRANPEASASWNGKTVPVRARTLSEGEAAPVWETAGRIYPGYRHYRRRASHRKIEVFLLEKA